MKRTAIFLGISLLALLISAACRGPGYPDPPKPKPEAPEQVSETAMKVLFIGNSLTHYHDMPDMLKAMALSGGKEVFIDQHTPPGVSLAFHSQSNGTIEKINERKWDQIILQSSDITAFPDLYDDEITVIERLKGHILSNHPQTRIIYLMVWGIKDGVTIRELNGELVYYSYETYAKKIDDGTLFIKHQCKIDIAPVGRIWAQIIAVRPELADFLFDLDGAHPGLYGSFLSACTYYTVLFSEGIKRPLASINIDSADQSYIIDKVASTVLNDMALWFSSKIVGQRSLYGK